MTLCIIQHRHAVQFDTPETGQNGQPHCLEGKSNHLVTCKYNHN